MAKTNKLILILIGIGIFSLALSLFIASQTEKRSPGLQPVGRVQLNLGTVYVLRKNLTKKELVTRASSLFPLDSVETSADGDATLDFDSTDRIHIQESSLVTLDVESERTVIIIKRGDVQVENFGPGDGLLISRDGKRWTTRDYELKFKQQDPGTTLPDLAPVTPEGIAPSSSVVTGLPTEFIQDVLKTHRPAFFKCYSQLLQRTPGVVGQASLGFTIERTGKISQAEVISSTLSDPLFKKCLLEVTRRVDFKSFSGDPISTIFPLKFE